MHPGEKQSFAFWLFRLLPKSPGLGHVSFSEPITGQGGHSFWLHKPGSQSWHLKHRVEPQLVVRGGDFFSLERYGWYD